MISDSSSLTWSAHLRLLCQLYKLPDPLSLLSTKVWPKEQWKLTIQAKIAAHHEAMLRSKAAANSKLQFLNIQASGLSGRPHPVLTGIISTQEVVRSRIHIKMLAGDYPCQKYIGTDRNQDQSCPLCISLFPVKPAQVDDMTHLLSRC